MTKEILSIPLRPSLRVYRDGDEIFISRSSDHETQTVQLNREELYRIVKVLSAAVEELDLEVY